MVSHLISRSNFLRFLYRNILIAPKLSRKLLKLSAAIIYRLGDNTPNPVFPKERSFFDFVEHGVPFRRLLY